MSPLEGPAPAPSAAGAGAHAAAGPGRCWQPPGGPGLAPPGHGPDTGVRDGRAAGRARGRDQAPALAADDAAGRADRRRGGGGAAVARAGRRDHAAGRAADRPRLLDEHELAVRRAVHVGLGEQLLRRQQLRAGHGAAHGHPAVLEGLELPRLAAGVDLPAALQRGAAARPAPPRQPDPRRLRRRHGERHGEHQRPGGQPPTRAGTCPSRPNSPARSPAATTCSRSWWTRAACRCRRSASAAARPASTSSSPVASTGTSGCGCSPRCSWPTCSPSRPTCSAPSPGSTSSAPSTRP